MSSVTMSGAARLWAAVSAVLALLLGTTVALNLSGPPAHETAAASAAAHTVDVTLTEFAVEPAEITVPAATPVSFALANDGTVPHDFAIEGVAGSELVPGGGTATLEVGPLEEGTYRVLCTEAGHEGAGMTATLVVTAGDIAEAGDAAGHSGTTAADMAAKHDDLSAFPYDTERGGQPLGPEVDSDGTKVFALTASEIDWEVEPGVTKPALAYNGTVPGPRIDVDLGDRVRIELTNQLSVPTALHLHGLVLPNGMDGVPGLTQESIMPGETFAYEFEVRNAGSHMYHSHFDSANQVPGGLLGAFIVHGPDEVEVDHDYVMILNDGPLGYTLNGKGFPATEPLAVAHGETVRIRYMNEGLQVHPMHLHGIPQQVVARDGYPLDSPYLEDNVLISPGDRIDVLVEATEPGAWAWHCHILSHAEGPDGMFGMVTALVVD